MVGFIFFVGLDFLNAFPPAELKKFESEVRQMIEPAPYEFRIR